MYTFEERVKDTKLTKSNRLIAEYCLNNQSTIAFQSAADLASCIGVSDVSIVRFARALGYDGFTDLKRAWQTELSQHIATNPDAVNPVSRFMTRKLNNQDDANFNLAKAEETYFSLIHDSFSNLSIRTLENIADHLWNSRTKYVVGIRTRCTAAISMATLLRMALPRVVSITSEDYSSYMQMQDFSNDDCVVFITFGRYSEFEQALLKQIKKSGAYLIVITDKRASRAAQAADVLLYCKGDINQPFYSSVGTVALAECIANAIFLRNWTDSQARIEQSEIYLNKSNPK